eukprot:GFKZ01006307.1.p1 GENE.GFKZ01006307.1~~GFKZ01006307.1.p1  ORF type:complete len:378 (+),score=32.29 GFKZ01006307.1:150-1283(+)
MTSAPASNRNPTDRNAEATVHIAQLDDKVTDAILWELMVQAGPVRHVYVPRDRITGNHYGYGFCEFHTPLDAQYATKVLNMVKLYTKPIRISHSTVDRRSQDVGANLFIGNLVDEVDEKLLHDTFSAFGHIIDTPYIMRDPLTNESKHYAFVKFASFQHSDAAIAAMDGQYVCNSPITVQYAFKRDANSRERHGSKAERILAAKAADAHRAANHHSALRPHTRFSDRPASAVPPPRPPPHHATAHPAMPQPLHHHPNHHHMPYSYAAPPHQRYPTHPMPASQYAVDVAPPVQQYPPRNPAQGYVAQYRPVGVEPARQPTWNRGNEQVGHVNQRPIGNMYWRQHPPPVPTNGAAQLNAPPAAQGVPRPVPDESAPPPP